MVTNFWVRFSLLHTGLSKPVTGIYVESEETGETVPGSRGLLPPGCPGALLRRQPVALTSMSAGVGLGPRQNRGLFWGRDRLWGPHGLRMSVTFSPNAVLEGQRSEWEKRARLRIDTTSRPRRATDSIPTGPGSQAVGVHPVSRRKG